MFHIYAQESAIVLAGAGLGWIALFSFVVAPVAFKSWDVGRADRLVRNVIKAGHGVLAFIALLSAAAALFSGAIAGAVVAALAAIFALCCQWALAPRDDPKPIMGRKVMKTARVVASALTALIMPVLIASILLTRMGI